MLKKIALSFDLIVPDQVPGSKVAEGYYLLLCKHGSSFLHKTLRECWLRSPFTFDRAKTFIQVLGEGINYMMSVDFSCLLTQKKNSSISIL